MIYAIFIGIMLSSFAMLLMGKVAIRYFAKLSDVPQNILMPMILLFCVFGTYAINNSTFDVAVMIGAGLLGYVMFHLKFAAAPLLIGFILGPLFEDNLRRTFLRGQGDPAAFFTSPICWIFLTLTILSVFFGLRQQKPRKSTQSQPEETTI